MSTASPSTSVVLDIDTTPTSLDFDPSLSEDEKRFYVKAYPSIELVRERKVHCTTCKCHIGTAPSAENGIKMHPVLRVTHCNKCHDFYNSGEFSKGEDGSELYCRWCGQGGEVYCCSNCPYVFCKSCIVKNLSRGVVADIEQNENWSCFNCAPKILWPLRAQHWALIKYIERQKKAITALNLPEAEAKQEMLKDRSTCCRLAKAKCGNMSDSMESIDSLSRRSVSGASTGSASKKTHKLASRSQSPAAKRPKSNNDDIVCTPDLLSMLEPDCQITVSAKPRPAQLPMASSPKVMSIQNPSSYGGGGGGNSMPSSASKNTPPPLVLRNTSVQMRPMASTPIVRRTVIGPRTATPGSTTPVYHTINGFRIDLNSAAQQETFRLPNGKLIQVKRQGAVVNPGSPAQSTPSPQPQQSPQTHNSWQRNMQMQQQSRPVQIAPAHPPNTQQYPQLTIQQHAPQQHPQMLRYQNTMVGNTTVTPLHNGSSAQIHVINGAAGGGGGHPQAHPHAALSQQAVPPARTLPVMIRHVFPDSAIGQARSQLQDQVFNAMEICQHLTGKVHTLTNSNAYKQARNYLEVKELYIHLSYLLTYAIGRFKGLQDKCLGDMRQLGFTNDADSLENGQLAADKQASDDEDNEIEIVEPKTDTITLDSDNDDDEPQSTAASTSSPCKSALQIALTQPKTTPQVTQSLQQATKSTPEKPGTPATNPATTPAPTPTPTPTATPTPTQVLSEVDIMSTAQSFLASMLEVDLSEGDQNSAQASPNGGAGGCVNGADGTQKKQPRKKTTNKPNPTLLKQKEILERERLEEMKRNDMKLKMKCTIELKKAEEEYPFAKDMLPGDEATAVNPAKKDDDNEEVEVLLVEDIDSSLEEEKEDENTKTEVFPKDDKVTSAKHRESEEHEEQSKTETDDKKELKGEINSKAEKQQAETDKPVIKVIVEASCAKLEGDKKSEESSKKVKDKETPTVTSSNEAKEQSKNTTEEKNTERVDGSEKVIVNEGVEIEISVNEHAKMEAEPEDLNTSECKEIEMIEVPEEEEEEVAENKADNNEQKSTRTKTQLDVKKDEKVAENNVQKGADKLEEPVVESSLNDDEELNEQIAKILQAKEPDADKDGDIVDVLPEKSLPENVPETESKEADGNLSKDLMDDIHELIENAMT